MNTKISGENCGLLEPTLLSKPEIESATRVLARAFQDYPLLENFIPNPAKRKKLLPHIYKIMVRQGNLYGRIYTTSPDLEGVAIWLSSDRADLTLMQMLRLGISPAFVFRTGRVLAKLLSYSSFASRIRRQHAPRLHGYLYTVGVDPPRRGKGRGGALIKSILRQMDRDRLPCYLETHDPAILPIYRHYGFHTVHADRVPGTEVNHWAMLRNPINQTVSDR